MKESTDLFLIDTNVLVYAYDLKDNPKKRKIALELIQKSWNDNQNYVVSVQNLAEFMFVLIGKVKDPEVIHQGELIVNDIIYSTNWKVISYNENTILHAISLFNETKSHFWDALIVATMLENKILNIYTENSSDFKKFKNINVVNPFENEKV
jgi:predicted nucleic acid-binding protein